MPSVTVPVGFANVLIRYRNATGHRCQNALGYSLNDVVTQDDVDDLSDLFAPAFKAQLNVGGSYTGLRVIVGNDGPELGFDSVSSAGAGTRSGEVCGPQVQGLIRKNTAFAGRAFHGRMFIPDMIESQVNDAGTVAAGGQSLLNGIIAAVNITAGTPFEAVHLLHPGVTLPTPITSFLVEDKVATQRRRYDR